MIKQILGTNEVVDLNSRPTLYSIFLIGVIAPEVFIVQPGFVQGLVEYLGFDDQGAGKVVSAEMWGLAATTILMTFIAHRVNWRGVVAGSLVVMFVANVACTLTTDVGTFVTLRFIAGLGAGSLVSLSFAAVGLTSNPDRNFGLLIMWVLTYGAIVLWAMPMAYESFGFNGVVWFFALFPMVAMPFVKHLPVSGETDAQVEEDAVNLSPQLKGMALFAMLAYFTAQGVVWAYLFLIGLSGGLGEQAVANGLMLSQFAGIAGALLAAVIAHRFGRTLPLTIGVLGGALCLYYLVGSFEFLAFAVAVCIYNFFWNLTHPFLLGAMASFDRHGRVVVYAVAMQMVGLAIGPYLAASVITEGEYINVNWTGAGLFFAAWLLILPPVMAQATQWRAARAVG
ncbi:MAG: MFS transporter [Gammaproteobacteria bacterium]|nr:MFS transporter [Gammaproteobacteria bacterium]